MTRLASFGALVSLVLLAGCPEGTPSLPPAKRAAVKAAPPPAPWPPVVGQAYPEVELVDQEGNPTRLSSFKGRVILVEPIGMACPACQAFAGAFTPRGAYGGASAQQGLSSIDELLPQFAKTKLDDPRLVYVQLLLYDMSSSRAPAAADAKAWAKHFGMERSRDRVVLAGDERYVNQASYDMIPGFQLIDRDFVLRSDSTGHNPKENLYDKLLPMIPGLLRP